MTDRALHGASLEATVGTVDHGQVEVRRRCPCRVQDFAAARPDDHLGLVLPGGRLDPLDLGQGTFAAEGVDGMVDAGLAESRLPGADSRRMAERPATTDAGPRRPRPTISLPSEAVAFFPWV